MVMVDGLCLVGGNNIEEEAPGCHNGGPNIGSDSAPRYAPVPGGPRNCPRCRWFTTRPHFLPQLVARWNNTMYHCNEAKIEVVRVEESFRILEENRAEVLSAGEIFTEQKSYLERQRQREQAMQRFDELAMTVAAITKLVERCRQALQEGTGTSLVSSGSAFDFEIAIQEVDYELLQLSGVCEDSELYPDLDSGKATLRRSQLLDAALLRDSLAPVFLYLSEEEQKLVGNAFLQQLSEQMNPDNPALGRHELVKLIETGDSLRSRLGPGIDNVLKVVAAPSQKRVIPIKNFTRKIL